MITLSFQPILSYPLVSSRVLPDSRRAAFSLNNQLYAAKLIDLPSIVESQKTLDGKQMFKVADISQVRFLVLQLVVP